jgi:hypothetical protein
VTFEMEVHMKKLMTAVLTAGAVLAAVPAAYAAQGCGPGFHRGPYGACRPNYGPGPAVVGPAFGVFYPGRGYWDGHRYWGHYHGGRYW